MTPDKIERIIKLYGSIMAEVKMRTDILADMPVDNSLVEYEYAALLFRKIAESIVYANLVGHEDEHLTNFPKSHYDWRIEKFIQRIKSINPNYYPVPITRDEVNAKDLKFRVRQGDDWLKEDELLEMYNKCSDLIHTRNPFVKQVDYEEFPTLFKKWGHAIVRLLEQHIVQVAGGDYSIMCIMLNLATNLPSVTIFKNTDMGGGVIKLKVIAQR